MSKLSISASSCRPCCVAGTRPLSCFLSWFRPPFYLNTETIYRPAILAFSIRSSIPFRHSFSFLFPTPNIRDILVLLQRLIFNFLTLCEFPRFPRPTAGIWLLNCQCSIVLTANVVGQIPELQRALVPVHSPTTIFFSNGHLCSLAAHSFGGNWPAELEKILGQCQRQRGGKIYWVNMANWISFKCAFIGSSSPGNRSSTKQPIYWTVYSS